MVVNTGPLILLGKIGALDFVGRLPVKFCCPPAVLGELEAGRARGREVVVPNWLAIERLSSSISPLVELSIDRGEAEVIQLALDKGISTVCIDDLHGRKVALSVGLRVTGSLGLLGRAKRLGFISRLRPFTDLLLGEGGRYSAKLIHDFLADFGE